MVLLATFDDRKEAQRVQRELLQQYPDLDNVVANPSMRQDWKKGQYVKREQQFEG